MATQNKINFPRYVMDHLCWAINEGTIKGRKQVPFGRLLSEIFHQGGVLKVLKKSRDASDKCFKASTAEKTISSRTFHSMHYFKTAPKDEKWLEMTTAESEIIRDFPSIVKKSNPEILAKSVVEYVLEEDASSQEVTTPIKTKGKKVKGVTATEATDDKPKQKKDAKRKRGKAETVFHKEKLDEALDELEKEEAEPRLKKKKAPLQMKSTMVNVTPAMKRMAKEHSDDFLANRREVKAMKELEREEEGERMLIVEEASAENVEQVQNLRTSEAVDNSAMLSKVPQVSHPSCTTSSIPSEDTSFLDHLESHYLGELPQSSFNSTSQKASEMTPEATTSDKVVSEDPPQQKPSPEKAFSPPQTEPTTSSPPTVPEPSIPEQVTPQKTVPEHIVPEKPVTKPIPEPEPIPEPASETTAPEHIVPEPTPASISPSPVQVIKITHHNGVCDMDTDSEGDQDDHASDMVVDPTPDQPSTSQSLTTNDQSSSNLPIVHLAPRKPSKQPSPPTIFLDSQVLQDVWEDIASEVLRLIAGINDLGHTISYQKQWKRIKERVVNLISALHDSCIEAQEQATQKLEDWLNGIGENTGDVEVLGTWVKNPLSIRGREPGEFLPKELHLIIPSEILEKNDAPNLALAQEKKKLKEENERLETELLEQKLKISKLETDMQEAKIREDNYKKEMDKKYADVQELLKKILEK